MLLLAALSSLLPAMRAAQTTRPPTRVDVSIATPPAAVAMDGRAWLVFELHVANRSADAVTLTEVEVTDGNGTRLAAFATDQLTRRLDRPADDAASPHEIRGGGTRVVYLELAMDGPMPAMIRHRVSTSSRAGAGDAFSGPVVVTASAPVVLGPPLAGGPWAAVHHPGWERGHRRVFYTVDGRARLPGRFAIDFVKLDDRGHTVRGDGDAPAPLGAEGLPFVFDRFEVLGRYLDIAAMGATRWTGEGLGHEARRVAGIERGPGLRLVAAAPIDTESPILAVLGREA